MSRNVNRNSQKPPKDTKTESTNRRVQKSDTSKSPYNQKLTITGCNPTQPMKVYSNSKTPLKPSGVSQTPDKTTTSNRRSPTVRNPSQSTRINSDTKTISKPSGKSQAPDKNTTSNKRSPTVRSPSQPTTVNSDTTATSKPLGASRATGKTTPDDKRSPTLTEVNQDTDIAPLGASQGQNKLIPTNKTGDNSERLVPLTLSSNLGRDFGPPLRQFHQLAHISN